MHRIPHKPMPPITLKDLPLSFMVGLTAVVGCMACILAAALLFCASSAYAQVMEEGGFPVKESGVRSELFSLSCPARLYARSGESVLFSCSATGVPEEGVRYEWRSVSGEGLRLLSDAQALSPVFTASLSGWGREYGYRLTATGPGVYATVSVTVTVEGASEATVRAPVAEAECGPFAIPEGFEKGCPEDKGPIPFGFGPESEEGFLFPEAPAPPDRLSGPVRGEGSDSQAPPRLDCPAAVFLEELETSFIECHAWDASGEEYLEYSWEPAGGTTRDYLENPRLIPEDSPTPSVIAPETPAYETLESFRSSETTFRYRYRLTAISRATGLSSHEEVEVYVSSSRPVVYCPLEVSVEEGGTVALDCEGADPLSSRMDYDEEAASVLWEWEGLWGTSMASLDATDLSSPLFTAPLGSAGEEYHYIASMTTWASGAPRTARRRVTVRVKVKERLDISVTCEDPGDVDEGADDIELACTARGAPEGSTYTWSWSPTDKLTDHDTASPTFDVPDVDKDTTYVYTVTASSDSTDSGSDDVSVTVRNVATVSPPSLTCNDTAVYEGNPDFEIDCTVENAPPDASYRWRGRDIDDRLSATDVLRPTFDVHDELDDITVVYTYNVTLSATGIDDVTANVTITVRERPDISNCLKGASFSADEGDPPIELETCRASPEGAPDGEYRYSWTVRANTPSSSLSLLTSTDTRVPTFNTPADVDSDTFYEYLQIISADNADPYLVDIEIQILDLDGTEFNLTCGNNDGSYDVYEGADDFVIACEAPGAPSDATWLWESRGLTANTKRLSATDISSPTFDVPDTGFGRGLFYYKVAVSDGSNSESKDIQVRIYRRSARIFSCGTKYSFYEGDSDSSIGNCTITYDNRIEPTSNHTWLWKATGATANTDRLSDISIPDPVFDVPSSVDKDEQYDYELIIDDDKVVYNVQVKVLDFNYQVSVQCEPPSYDVTEGLPEFQLNCSASGGPEGSAYSYRWYPIAPTTTLSHLRGEKSPTPTFVVPENVDNDTIFMYRVHADAANSKPGSYTVMITVRNKPPLSVVCSDPGSAYEGSEDVTFDCEASGSPSGSGYAYVWEAVGDTQDTSLLSAADIVSPTFLVPDEVSETTTYEYRLTASAENAEDGAAEVAVTVLNTGALSVVCSDPGSAYEGSDDITFDCEASGSPSGSGYAYVWEAVGDTQDTSLLSASDIVSPTFLVPDEVSETTTYEYRLTASAENAEAAAAEVTVTVLNTGALSVVCSDPGSAYEGSEDVTFDCEASGSPSGSGYAYVWEAVGDTQDTSLLSAADIVSPTFLVPDEVSETTTYEYRLTASAENAEDGAAEVAVTVLNTGALAVVCSDPGSAYEGSEDVTFDCEASGSPSGSGYAYVWEAVGDTQDTSLLSASDIVSPTFLVPDEVSETTTYEYRLTASAENAEAAAAEVTVTVLNTGALSVVCSDPGSAYEGSEDVTFDCEASGSPSGSGYAYVWEAVGDTQDTSLLSAADIVSPTFLVPDEVSETTTYEYRLTASAENAEDGAAEVAVTVLNTGALSVVCSDPGSAYEGSDDITFDCEASGSPSGSGYAYVWEAVGDTQDTSLLSASDIVSPTFLVPDEVSETTTYEYRLTASAENAEAAAAEVTVTVLNTGALSVVCSDPGSAYEGSEDVTFDCEASGSPSGSGYAYVWEAVGDTQDTSLLSAADIVSPTFLVPDEVSETTTYEYRLTASAENAEDGAAEVAVTVLNTGALAVVCSDPGSAYEGSEDVTFDCEASGSPSGSGYAYVWEAVGDTQDTSLLSASDIVSPTFLVPDEVSETTTYEYRLTASAENAEAAAAEVTVTVLNTGALSVVCSDPGSAYEGSEDVTFDCEASGSPSGSGYAYVWEAVGDTQDTSLLSAADIVSPTFLVPDEVSETTTYEYRLTASAENAEAAAAEVTVTVLNTGALAVVCSDPGSAYEGSEDVTFDCEASGSPSGSGYAYVWEAVGDTQDTSLLSASDIVSPTFLVPDEVSETTTYEYRLTASAENAEDGAAEVTVTVLNTGALSVVCSDPGSAYEGSEDVTFDCEASGSPSGSGYAYVWEAVGDTQDTSLLSASDIVSPTFLVPDEVSETTTYEYRLTASAENAEDGAAEVTVTVLDRIQGPDPVPPPGDSSAPVASSSGRESSDLSELGITVSAWPVRFGVQSADTEVSLDPMTDGISTYVSGPYHTGRMTLSPDGSEATGENGEMDLAIELVSPVVLKRADAMEEASSLVLTPLWSYSESCERLSSQTIGGGLYMEVTLREETCRLLHFGGELDLTGASPGQYAGNIDLVLRSGEREETFAVAASVTVVPAQRVITIGPGGVRFSTSREVPAALTEEQSLSIYPGVAFLTEGKPDGVFELSNPSLIPLEISVSARFGYTEATEHGREVMVEDASQSRLGDLSGLVDIHPGVLVLMPGEKGLIRYGVKEGAHAAMAEQGYAAFFDVVSHPRQYADMARMPEKVTGDRMARVTMRVPGVYVPGEGASQLSARLLSISYPDSLSATFLLETPDHPFAGDVVVYDGDSRELGYKETLVYTRSRVRIPLDRMPEEGTVFLRFVPRGSGRAPLPASVEWNAPFGYIGGDIGDAENKVRTSIPATLARKP